MVTPAAMRGAVAHMVEVFAVSQQWVCAVLGVE